MPEKNATLFTEGMIGAGVSEDRRYVNIERSFPVVAIGISAGGQEAITRLLDHLTPSVGMSYVVIQHTSMGQAAIIPELLKNKTKIKVSAGREGLRLEKDQLYILPPGMYMGITDGWLTRPSFLRKGGGNQNPIDFFFTALAAAYEENAIAVILSGEKTDGTAGIQAIRKEGGITFAQDDTARCRTMPRHAIESGYIDFILSPERIAVQLAALKNNSKSPSGPAQMESNKTALSKIYFLLSDRYKVDFSLYSQDAVIKRILRRMKIAQTPDLQDYAKLLLEDRSEIDLLYTDLLPEMAGFFRDATFFQVLTRQILPGLLKNKGLGDQVRIWISGCNSGEEVYSMAICLWEYWREKGIDLPLRIFATDLGEAIIERARKGIYNDLTLQNVSVLRLKRFFEKGDGTYQVGKDIRDLCVFAVHDLLKDPPFSGIDIVCCENVMIRLNPDSRKRMGQVFHYSLRPSGYLLPGKLETAGDLEELFSPMDEERRVYTKKDVPVSRQLDFSFRSKVLAPSSGGENEKEAEALLLSRYVPASILIDRDLQIIRFYGAVSSYLRPVQGKASLQLFKMVRDELVFELHSLLDKLKSTGQAVKKDNIRLFYDGNMKEVALEVIPVKSSSSESLLLVVIRSLQGLVRKESMMATGKREEDDKKDRRIRELEEELFEARRHILSISEAFDKAREEIQSTHEEVLSSNEELQSLNEQLEISRAELQSTNEDLISLNEKIQFRNNELKESVEYATAIVETVQDPLLVLNGDLRIRTANKAFYDCFRLQPHTTEGYYLQEVGDGMFLRRLSRQLHQVISKKIFSRDFEWAYQSPVLGERIMLCHFMPMGPGTGRNATLLLSMEDITDLKIPH